MQLFMILFSELILFQNELVSCYDLICVNFGRIALKSDASMNICKIHKFEKKVKENMQF